MIFRNATSSDINQILEIYSPFISNTVVTFENEIPSVADFSKRLNQYLEFFPWLVADIDGKIAGYAYASKYRDRIAYQWVVEASIYMHRDFKKKGIAKKLYEALFEILKLQGIYRVYAVIGIPNEESTSFHERLGFTWFASYKSTGFKLGQWRDTGWWELVLKQPSENPEPPIYYPELDKLTVNEILKRYADSI